MRCLDAPDVLSYNDQNVYLGGQTVCSSLCLGKGGEIR